MDGWVIGSGKHTNRFVVDCTNGAADWYFAGARCGATGPMSCQSWLEKDCSMGRTAGEGATLHRVCKMVANPSLHVTLYHGH